MNGDELIRKRFVPEKLEVLSRETGIEKRWIQSFYRVFKQSCPSGAINELTFKNIYCQLFPEGADPRAYAHYIYRALDIRQSGNITFSELIRRLSCLVKGPLKERLEWIFRLYDINRDGEISLEEMTTMVEAIHDMVGPSCGKSESHANYVFQKIDLNSDGVITLDEFITFCFTDEIAYKSLANFASCIGSGNLLCDADNYPYFTEIVFSYKVRVTKEWTRTSQSNSVV